MNQQGALPKSETESVEKVLQSIHPMSLMTCRCGAQKEDRFELPYTCDACQESIRRAWLAWKLSRAQRVALALVFVILAPPMVALHYVYVWPTKYVEQSRVRAVPDAATCSFEECRNPSKDLYETTIVTGWKKSTGGKFRMKPILEERKTPLCEVHADHALTKRWPTTMPVLGLSIGLAIGLFFPIIPAAVLYGIFAKRARRRITRDPSSPSPRR